MMVVSFTTTTLVAATPSKETAFVPGKLSWKPRPVRVTPFPPPAPPLVDATKAKVGSGWTVLAHSPLQAATDRAPKRMQIDQSPVRRTRHGDVRL